MNTRNPSGIVIKALLVLFLLVNIAHADNSRSRTPARVLAKETGATQFEEERYETHTDCNDHKHHLKKRSSDEDVDYEVYQGVVGRPGIDFPIYPRIPKTTFSCRSYGNGYFADMETDCQVFHICEEGRKISFLCPNGTIFQQSELTCDWWFKVNCLGSQGYYHESAEILSKQRVHRVRPSVPVQGFNIVGGATNIGLNIKSRNKASVTPRTRHSNKQSERRIDSNEEPALESIDFEDISSEKQRKAQPSHTRISSIDDNNNDNGESQITAESASFVGSQRRNSYAYDKPSTDTQERSKISRRVNGDRGSQRRGYTQASHNEQTERSRSGQRGHQRYHEDVKKPLAESLERHSGEEQNKDTPKASALPEKIIQASGMESNHGGKSRNQLEITSEPDIKPEFYETPTSHATTKTQHTTAAYSVGTYSTARRLDSTRTTPFYTPTVPTVIKSKSTEVKSVYSKNVNAVTTPSPHRFGAAVATFPSSSLVLESSVVPKSTTASKPTVAILTSDRVRTTTLRPFIIGMRHHYDTTETSPIANGYNNYLDLALPLKKVSTKSSVSTTSELLETTTQATVSTGPTYLPKSATLPVENADSAGDLLLFAPSPANVESVSRNVNDMLKTMNLLKDTIGSSKLQNVEELKFLGQTRAGLEIPPSSGPDALVTFAKYFASEHNGSSGNSLNDIGTMKPEKQSNVGVTYTTNHASDSTTALKSAHATDANSKTDEPVVNIKSDDIKASLLSEKTVNKYSNLFGLRDVQSKNLQSDPSEGLLSHNSDTNVTTKSDTATVISSFPQIGSTDASIRSIVEKPESRKIAQVFSNALTTYLEDPQLFREQLTSVRPTEPPVGGKANFDIVAVTDSTLFNSGTAATYLPTKPTTTFELSTTPVPKTSNIAAEINNNFDYSTQVIDLGSRTTDLYDSTTTYRPLLSDKSMEQSLRLELSAELLPPSPESGEGEEFLQSEQTQSFAKSRNQLHNDVTKTQKHRESNAAYVAAVDVKPTENPWNHMSQSDFLDPLTINDGLMKVPRTTTASPYTYLPKETTTPLTTESRGVFGKEELLLAQTQRAHKADVSRPAQYAQYRQSLDSSESWRDIFSTYDLPMETLPSSSGLQRIANKLFGGLNDNEALHLKNVMQKAEHDRQVLSLLLLLIQTCDDHNGKALERSRKHLLNALIDMDSKVQSSSIAGKESHHRSDVDHFSIPSTTSRVPVTTYRRGSEEVITSTTTDATYPSTTTDLPSTTITASTILPDGIDESTKFEIRVEDPEADLVTTSTIGQKETGVNGSSDKRALELLKSLYSLASKFTSRR